MAQLTGETVRQIARDLYDYEMAERDAASTANVVGAMLTLARHQASGLAGVEAPFGYPNLFAEAERIIRQKRQSESR